jgi:uncharacterized protein YecE (DUF72 family)
MSDIADRKTKAGRFEFRGLSPNVRFGTASDRYAGWIGQIYPEDYRSRISSRRRKLGNKTFEERTVPVESIADYFEHFEVLELDFTFYRTLIGPDGKPSNNYVVLQRYADSAPDHARFFLKAPQAFFARKLRRRTGGKLSYVQNPDFLDAEAYTQTFLYPALEILGDRTLGIIFEQEYQRKADSPDPGDNVAELSEFFSSIPDLVQSHIELRSSHLLQPAYFDWLQSSEIGFVFSHWTWLPPLRKQWMLSGERFAARDRNVVVRLLTPLNVPYAEAYSRTHPFDRVVRDVAESDQARRMVLDTAALAFCAEAEDATLNVIANNRAWGNAPELAKTVALRILEEEEGRASDRNQSRP